MRLVAVEVDGPVASIRLNRPEKRNALSSGVAEALAAAVAGLDDGTRVVVLAGAGPCFCAGADVSEMAGLDPASAEAFIRGLHRAIAAVRDCPVPVVAAVHGACVGAGLELIAGCDARVASESARFAMPEVQVGIPSVIEAALLPALIGRGRTSRLLLTGETIDAATAERWGLVEELVPDDRLVAAARAVADAIAAADPAAIRAQKALMRRWEDLATDQAIEAGVQAFANSYRSDAPSVRLRAALDRRR